MLIAPIVSTAPSVLTGPRPASAPLSSVPSAPRIGMPSAAASAAILGAQIVATPTFDFPGIATGNMFDLAPGSKVGMFSPKGTAKVERFEPDVAAFHIVASAFGVKADMLVTVQRINATQVQLTSKSADGKVNTAVGSIVATRPNYAEFLSADGKNERTIISRDASGMVTIDAVVPTFGAAHLLLKPRAAAPVEPTPVD